MNPLKLTFTANEQALTKTDNFTDFASNTVSYIEATFTLGENWTGYDSVRAVWKTDYYTITTVLDANFTCVVPTEVLRYKAKVFVNLVGSIVENDALTDRLTTFPVLALTVKANAAVNGTETVPVTPSQFEQFVEAVQDAAGSISDYSYDSEAWAVGKRGGVDVPSTDQTYHNNSKYWAEQNAGLSDEVADLKEDLNEIKTETYTDSFTVVKNSFVNTQDGSFAPYAGWDRTDYMPLGTAYKIHVTANPSSTYNGFYDKDHNYLGRFSTGVDVVIPDNAFYYVLSNTASAMTTEAPVRTGNKNVEQLNKVSAEFETVVGRNKCSNVATVGTTVLYLPVYLENGEKYIIANPDSEGDVNCLLGICTQDSSTPIITVVNYGAFHPKGYYSIFDFDSTTGWYRLKFGKTSALTAEEIATFSTGWVVEEYTGEPVSEFIPFEELYAVKNAVRIVGDDTTSTWYNGKVLYTYGDSITEQATWQKTLVAKIGLDSYINGGHGGIRLNQLCTDEYYSELAEETFDCVFVMGGTNDWSQSVPIGETTDATNATFCGAVNILCDKLSEDYPTMPIFFSTPPFGAMPNSETKTDNGRKNTLGLTTKAYGEAMKTVCALWGIPCFDLYSNGMANVNNMTQCFEYVRDGSCLHPTASYGRQMANLFTSFMLSNEPV